jgi:para-nitrobenzyl esterase
MAGPACLGQFSYFVLAVAAWCGAAAGLASAQVRQTQNGPVQGLTVGSEAQFLGIPFAAPPVGTLRWQSPQPPANWQGTLPATAFGAECPQLGQTSASEDCLTLNVFAPASAAPGSKLPVLVWIYGGSFSAGASGMYDPTTLVTRGNVVAVTLNYRIGYLGFLAHPALSAADPDHVSGNYGILDQKYALAWVRNNIANFGGDPSQITVFGESAGGQSVYAQLILKHPVKLKAAIAESGAFQTNYPTLATAEAAGEQAAAALGCADQTLSCLQGLSATTLANALNPLTNAGGISPVIDGVNLPSGPAVAFSQGKFEKIPIINGGNHDEMRLFVAFAQFFGAAPLTEAGYVANVQAAYGANAASVLAQYPLSHYTTPDYAWAAVETDSIFACNTHLLNAQLSPYTTAYVYELNDPNGPEPVGPTIPGFTYGSAHGSDMSFLFPTLFAPVIRTGPPQLTPAELTLAGTLQDFWLSLARYGRPLAPRSGAWLSFTNASPNVLSLVPPATAIESQFVANHHCAFWAPRLLSEAGLPQGSAY